MTEDLHVPVDALTRRRPNGDPAVGRGKRYHAVEVLERHVLTDASATAAVLNVAVSDGDARIRRRASDALERAIRRGLRSDSRVRRLAALELAGKLRAERRRPNLARS